MDLDEGKDKVYININIQHRPTYGFSSLASARYKLFKPLIDKGGNYQVCVTDMQVDTKCIPLFVAEFLPEQMADSILANENKTIKESDDCIYLNYWIQVSQNYNEGIKIYLKKKVKTNIAAYDKTTKEYSNDNENAYIYSHQEFLDLVNIALGEALFMSGAHRDRYGCGYVIRNDRLVLVVQDCTLYNRLLGANNNPVKIRFSQSLYQYLGVGFPVKTNSVDYWEYDFTVPGQRPYTEIYFSMIQTMPCLQSWNACKAIVCYTQDLPITDEIFPTATVKPSLTHYTKSDGVAQTYSTSEIHRKILYVHYIDYTRIRTLANGIVVHNMCVDGGLKINVEKKLPIEKIDIHLGWLDAFGNLFPLRLNYGCCCNVRLCFTRKTVQEKYDYVQHDGVQRQMFYIPNEGVEQTGYPGNMPWENVEYEAVPPEMQIDENSKQALYYTPPSMMRQFIDPETQQQYVTPLYDPSLKVPVETLTAFKEHVEKLATEARDRQEQAEAPVIAPPEEPVHTEEPPPLDEKEQFYQRQQEILNQYKEFNNKLN